MAPLSSKDGNPRAGNAGHAPVACARADLKGGLSVSDFLQTSPGTLTLADRRLIVDRALVLLEQNDVQLPLKVAMQRRQRLGRPRDRTDSRGR